MNRRPARHGTMAAVCARNATRRCSDAATDTAARPGQKQSSPSPSPWSVASLRRADRALAWWLLGLVWVVVVRCCARAARRYRACNCKLEWTKRAPRCTYAVSTGASAFHGSTPARPSHARLVSKPQQLLLLVHGSTAPANAGKLWSLSPQGEKMKQKNWKRNVVGMYISLASFTFVVIRIQK